MKKCICCGDLLPENAFPKYRRVCKSCYRGRDRLRVERKKNRAFNALVNWKVVLLLVIVVGIYSHDYVKGQLRTCVYDSLYGQHSVTISAMRMCPLTYEFEID